VEHTSNSKGNMEDVVNPPTRNQATTVNDVSLGLPSDISLDVRITEENKSSFDRMEHPTENKRQDSYINFMAQKNDNSCSSRLCLWCCCCGSRKLFYLNCYKHRFHRRRILLLLVVIIILLWWFLPLSLDRTQQTYLLAGYIFLCTFILLYNVPYLLQYMHTRPWYYEDLERSAPPDVKLQFQQLFNMWMNVSCSLFASLLIAYRYYYHWADWGGWFVELGALGGLWSLYCRLQNWMGSFLLSVQFYYINSALLHK
jgi:hypothetical protein